MNLIGVSDTGQPETIKVSKEGLDLLQNPAALTSQAQNSNNLDTPLSRFVRAFHDWQWARTGGDARYANFAQGDFEKMLLALDDVFSGMTLTEPERNELQNFANSLAESARQACKA